MCPRGLAEVMLALTAGCPVPGRGAGLRAPLSRGVGKANPRYLPARV